LGTVPDGLSNTILTAERYPYFTLNVPTGYNYYNAWWYPAGLLWSTAGGVNGNAPMFGYYSTAVPQSVPTLAAADYRVPQSAHTGGMVAGMADGSTRMAAANVAAATWQAVLTPDDGTPLPSDW